MIARKRGLKIRVGEPDIEKGAHTLLQDYRSGAIGRVSLETPESRRVMLESFDGENQKTDKNE